jgi:hypothetical protein
MQQSNNISDTNTTVGLIPTINSRGKLVFGNEIESEGEESDSSSTRNHKI